jgi:hypothetical protein
MVLPPPQQRQSQMPPNVSAFATWILKRIKKQPKKYTLPPKKISYKISKNHKSAPPRLKMNNLLATETEIITHHQMKSRS